MISVRRFSALLAGVSFPRNNPQNFSVDPATSFSSSLDNTNRNRFVYNANQFGFNGGYYFVRLNFVFPGSN